MATRLSSSSGTCLLYFGIWRKGAITVLCVPRGEGWVCAHNTRKLESDIQCVMLISLQSWDNPTQFPVECWHFPFCCIKKFENWRIWSVYLLGIVDCCIKVHPVPTLDESTWIWKEYWVDGIGELYLGWLSFSIRKIFSFSSAQWNEVESLRRS